MTSVNIKNPAIKRIHADVRELIKDPSDQYHAAPLESNLFEWHFTLRGPPETPFEGGVYHGRILLPPEYPFKPPDIVFTTPNGRFAVGTKICLTISSYHPEYWQPAWGIRLILEALISFFPSLSMGALGGLDWSEKERKRLALESTEWKCYKCGHAKALLPELKPKTAAGDSEGGGSGGMAGSNRYAAQIKELHKLKAKTAEDIAAESRAKKAATTAGAGDGPVLSEEVPVASVNPGLPASGEVDAGPKTGARERTPSRTGVSPVSDDTIIPRIIDATASVASDATGGSSRHEENENATTKRNNDDELLTYMAVAIAMAIAGILLRKFMRQVMV